MQCERSNRLTWKPKWQARGNATQQRFTHTSIVPICVKKKLVICYNSQILELGCRDFIICSHKSISKVGSDSRCPILSVEDLFFVDLELCTGGFVMLKTRAYLPQTQRSALLC